MGLVWKLFNSTNMWCIKKISKSNLYRSVGRLWDKLLIKKDEILEKLLANFRLNSLLANYGNFWMKILLNFGFLGLGKWVIWEQFFVLILYPTPKIQFLHDVALLQLQIARRVNYHVRQMIPLLADVIIINSRKIQRFHATSNQIPDLCPLNLLNVIVARIIHCI